MHKITYLGTPEIQSHVTASTIPDLSREEVRVGAVLPAMSAEPPFRRESRLTYNLAAVDPNHVVIPWLDGYFRVFIA